MSESITANILAGIRFPENNVNVIQQSANNKKKLLEKRNGANLSENNSNGLFFIIIFFWLNMEQIIANLLVADNAVIQKV